MLQKFMNNTSNSEHAVITKSGERQKNQFSKRIGRKYRPVKPVLNKIMNTQGQWVKCNFVDPLI